MSQLHVTTLQVPNSHLTKIEDQVLPEILDQVATIQSDYDFWPIFGNRESMDKQVRRMRSSSSASNDHMSDMFFDDLLSSSRNRGSVDTNPATSSNEAEAESGSTDAANSANSNARGRVGDKYSIVYVVGGSYPGNHPILLAPTLFTDNPSYEDLLILENFMGQAKPPVATKEEVNSSGGIFKIGRDGFQVRPEERCLVCLSTYEENEVLRKLKNCGHTFHKDCIDQWLTTGRNSCPLCRGEGVMKAKQSSDSSSSVNNDGSNQTNEAL